jgi:hypothetical protein
MKIKVAHVTVIVAPPQPGSMQPETLVWATDTKGRVWERASGMDPGVWGELELPNEPRPKRRRKRP